MTPEQLLAAGYRQFHDQITGLGDFYRTSFQKIIIDEFGIRYFITITHGVFPTGPDRSAQPFFTPSTQFHRRNSTFNVTMLHHDETVEEVEAFFDELWQTLTLAYYEGGTPDRRRS